MKNLILALILSLTLIACGGSSSNDSGILIEGKITQGESAGHKLAYLKHSEGENIEEVEVCALGKCSTTATDGTWGFTAPESFSSGDVLFTIKGHGIDDEVIVHIHEAMHQVYIHFQNEEDGIMLHHVEIDGVRQEADEHAPSSDPEHEHEESDTEHAH